MSDPNQSVQRTRSKEHVDSQVPKAEDFARGEQLVREPGQKITRPGHRRLLVRCVSRDSSRGSPAVLRIIFQIVLGIIWNLFGAAHELRCVRGGPGIGGGGAMVWMSEVSNDVGGSGWVERSRRVIKTKSEPSLQ